MQQTGYPPSDMKGKTDRETAAEMIYQILEKGAFSNLILEKFLSASQVRSEKKKRITEMVNGTVRMCLRLDWTLSRFLKKEIHKLNPWLRNILRLSAYQILFMEKVPDHAVVSEAVKLTRKKASEGLTGLCNGVLRSLLREKEKIPGWIQEIPNFLQREAVWYSLPEEILKEIPVSFSEKEREEIFTFFNQPGRMELRTNQLKRTPEELVAALQEKKIQAEILDSVPGAIEISELPSSLSLSELMQDGTFYVQNRASQLAAFIVDPKPGELILDLCSGLGGKSTHLAEKSQDRSRVIAVERYAHKLRLLLENCERLGIHSIEPLCADITKGLPAFQRKADRVLLDAPCSGWGVLNRRADLRWNLDEGKKKELETLQRVLLFEAAKLVRPGGVLVFSTCTFRPEENEKNLLALLEQYPEYELEGFESLISFFPLSKEDQQKAETGMMTIFPGIYGTDGMFYGKLRKRV